MSDAAFIRAIIAEPDADDHRIVYADYLEQHGDLARAELIRVQCELTGYDSGRNEPAGETAAEVDRKWRERDAWVDALRRRERELLTGRGGDWSPSRGFVRGRRHGWRLAESGPTVEWSDRTAVTFARGFPTIITLSWADFQTHAKHLLAAAPIARVNRPRECGECKGTGWASMLLDDWPHRCRACDGQGTVDDWRGDGAVRLTDLPVIDLVRQTSNGYVQRIRGGRCEVETGYGEPYESVFLKATNAEYPGVRFELPAVEARLNDFVRDTLRQQGFSDEQIASWDRLREFTDYAARIATASPAMTALRTVLSSTTGGRP